MGNTVPFAGPETPTTTQLMDDLHAKLGLEKVNVLKMKEAPPPDAHPKILRAYWMAKSLTDMWRTAFQAVLADTETFGLTSTSGMAIDPQELEWQVGMVDDPNDITRGLLQLTGTTIDMTVSRFGFDMRSNRTDASSVANENFRQANLVNRDLVSDPQTLSRMRESEWNMEAASRQGFRAARDADWRLMGVVPRVAVRHHGTVLDAQQVSIALDGVGPTLSALADAHEQVFLAIRAVLRGTPDHQPDLPYNWRHFHLADRHGRLTLEIQPEVFETVLHNPPAITDPWTGCPSLPFLRQYHDWSAAIAKRFYAPQFPRIQQQLMGQNTEPIRAETSPELPPRKEGLAT